MGQCYGTWWADAEEGTGPPGRLLDVGPWLAWGWEQLYPTVTPPPGAGGWLAGARARLVVLSILGVDCTL